MNIRYNTEAKMDKAKIAATAASICFLAFACAGIVSGREWRLLLVPLAIMPLLRLCKQPSLDTCLRSPCTCRFMFPA